MSKIAIHRQMIKNELNKIQTPEGMFEQYSRAFGFNKYTKKELIELNKQAKALYDLYKKQLKEVKND